MTITTRARANSWAGCSLCAQPPHVVLAGSANCNYCGNEIPLCRKHAAQLFDELLAIRNEDSAEATAKKKAKKKLRWNTAKKKAKKKLRWNTACDKVIREILGEGPCE